MESPFEKQWVDFKGRYGSTSCPFCKNQSLNFDEPKFGTVVGIEVVAVSCRECGHIELFDVPTVKSVADEIDRDFHVRGWR